MKKPRTKERDTKPKDPAAETAPAAPRFGPVPAEALGERCQVTVAASVLNAVRRHARSSMSAEVCGVLIGEETPEGTLIEAAISGENAAQGGAHVTFTQDAWEHIYGVKDRDYPDKRIVGWYHSHPGFGIFLSRHDAFIHENFFSAPGQVAWVYDPHSEEEGCFGWVDGKLRRLSLVRVVDTDYAASPALLDEPEAGDEDEDEPEEGSPAGSASASKWTGLRKKLILLFCFAVVFIAGVAAGLLVMPVPVMVYSLPDGRILSEAEAHALLERAFTLQREQNRREGEAGQDSQGDDGANPRPEAPREGTVP